MSLKETVLSLSEIEKKALAALTKAPKHEHEIAQEVGINIDSARRAGAWLVQKGLANSHESKSKKITLTEQGRKYLESGLPEKRMLHALAGKEMTFKELQQSAALSPQEFSYALGTNKKKAFIAIIRKGDENYASATGVAAEFADKTESVLAELGKKGTTHEKEILSGLISRGLAGEKEITDRKLSITKDGEAALEMKEFGAKRNYNVSEPVPEIYIGKKQPYIQFLNIVRRKLTELGFKEMEAPLIVPEFYNFDVLFQPQNHPARTWTDTYQLKAPNTGKLSDRRAVEAIKAAHENGGVSGSTGWRYKWSEEIASKIMPAAHGTAHTARQLTKITQKDIPCKYFTIARCFRPDVLDATHLIEFNQTDGFILGENLNFRHQLGVLEQFAKEIAGAEEVKFLPDYYPFTEPSVQLSAKHPTLGWVELGGAGMLRPEILKNLGINCSGFAWGIGIDRLAMFKLGIKDIRYLFSDNLDWLRKTPQVMDEGLKANSTKEGAR